MILTKFLKIDTLRVVLHWQKIYKIVFFVEKFEKVILGIQKTENSRIFETLYEIFQEKNLTSHKIKSFFKFFDTQIKKR